MHKDFTAGVDHHNLDRPVQEVPPSHLLARNVAQNPVLKIHDLDGLLTVPARLDKFTSHLLVYRRRRNRPQEAGVRFGQGGVDEHPGAQFKPGTVRQSGHQGDVPMEHPGSLDFGVGRAHHQVVVGIAQPVIEPGQQILQKFGQGL